MAQVSNYIREYQITRYLRLSTFYHYIAFINIGSEREKIKVKKNINKLAEEVVLDDTINRTDDDKDTYGYATPRESQVSRT